MIAYAISLRRLTRTGVSEGWRSKRTEHVHGFGMLCGLIREWESWWNELEMILEREIKNTYLICISDEQCICKLRWDQLERLTHVDQEQRGGDDEPMW